jgi:hypothetical protein
VTQLVDRTVLGVPTASAGPEVFHDDAPRTGRREFTEPEVVTPVLRTDFDVSAYTYDVGGRILVDADLVAEQADAQADALALADLRRDLTYLHAVESAALTEVRTMYSSWTANEARINAFIATWLWDRFWWARAIRDLRDSLPTTAVTLVPSGHRPLGAKLRDLYVDHGIPIMGPGWTKVVGENVTAGHMARMAIQEASLQAAYAALLPRVPEGSEARRVLEETMARRTVAVDFFQQEAKARITAVGGDPLRPAGQWIADEDLARPSIFRTAQDRGALRAARFEIMRLLPLPSGLIPFRKDGGR